MSYLAMLRDRTRRPDAVTAASGHHEVANTIEGSMRLLNLASVRIMRNGSRLQIGVWEDLDSPEIRQALRAVGLDVHPVVYLGGADAPIRFKERRVPDRAKGESFPAWLERAEQTLPAVVEYKGVLRCFEIFLDCLGDQIPRLRVDRHYIYYRHGRSLRVTR